MAEQQPKDVVLALFKGETAPPVLIRRAEKQIADFTEDSGFDRVEVWHEGAIVLVFGAVDASIRKTSAVGTVERAVELRATIRSLVGDEDVGWQCVISRQATPQQRRTVVSRLEVTGGVILKLAETEPLTQLPELIKARAFDAGTPPLPWITPAGEKAKVRVRTCPHDIDEKKDSTANAQRLQRHELGCELFAGSRDHRREPPRSGVFAEERQERER